MLHRVDLETLRPKLTILSRAFTGRPIEIITAEREGGWKNNSFFLPESISLLPTVEGNVSFYLFRILYLSIQQNLNLNWQSDEAKTLIESQSEAIQTSEYVLQTLFLEYPNTKSIYQQLEQYVPIVQLKNKQTEKDRTWLFGKWMKNKPELNNAKDLNNVSEKYLQKNSPTPTTEIKAKATEEVEVIEADKKAQEEYVINHNFEKVETAEEFSGVWRNFDGEDSLEDDENALEELNMTHVVRVDDPVHSIYQAEFAENATIAESSEAEAKGHFELYDEWNFKKKSYKKSFCKVFPKKIKGDHLDYYKDTLKDNKTLLTGLRKMLSNINNKYNQLPRQQSGDEFDIDAVTDLFADIQANHTPSENIYYYKKKNEKDLSILLLLDISLSSDGYVDGNRILDVEKQTAMLFGEIMSEYNVDLEVAGFFSKTRNFCTYLTLKAFDESWDTGKKNIGAVQPSGYTRIGGALRHAGSVIEKRPAKNKWVILISDGKPNDFDKYEGKYGIADVKQALRELKTRHINSYALAIEDQAKHYLPQMFGQNHYQILSSPKTLITSAVKLYEKIKHAG
jgi:nitric oxide reductase NorD protein